MCCGLWTLCHTIQHRALLIIFPLNLEIITITRMLSHCPIAVIYRVSNRSAGMTSSRFPGDIFTQTQYNLQFFRNDNDLPGRVVNPWYHTDLFTRSTAQLTDIYWGLLTTISIHLGILWDVTTSTLWNTRILHHITTNTQTQPENFQETLLISSRFPGGKIIPVDFQDFQEC